MPSEFTQLPYPIYFVNEHVDKFRDLLNNNELPTDLEPLYAKCDSGVDIWTAQVFIHLKQRGLNVHFVRRFVPGQICVVAYHHLKVRSPQYNSYVVACQYDCARPEICEQRIVLNERVVLDENDHFVHHWPHPLLKPRDSARGATLETLAFKGCPGNLAQPFHDPAFQAQIKALGIELCFSTNDPLLKSRDWGDYTHSDLVLAVRNATERDLWLKPAVKLINSWQAGCPALLGPEPAYQQLRRSELDYIEVRSPKDVIAALKYLKDNPAIYTAMIEHGLKRSQEFTVDRLAMRWCEILSGPVAQGYEQWQQQSLGFKVFGRPIQYVNRAVRHKRELSEYFFRREHGRRLFNDPRIVPTPISAPDLSELSRPRIRELA